MHSQEVFKAPSGWKEVWQSAKDELEFVSSMLEKEEKKYTLFPLEHELYNAFYDLFPESVKVVIVGQDPYHGQNPDGSPQANGMAFSTRPDKTPPSSLKNIFKEIKKNYPDFSEPQDGYLGPWKDQGVLLLNSSLTVRQDKAGSHKQLWYGFIKKVIQAVCTANPSCIFVLWGRKSQELEKFVSNRVYVLKAAHPSGLSANRGFFGCQHFSEINEILERNDKEPIDWSL